MPTVAFGTKHSTLLERTSIPKLTSRSLNYARAFAFVCAGMGMLLTGCDGGDGSSNDNSGVTAGSVVKGPVRDATIEITDKEGNTVASFPAGNDSRFSVHLPEDATYPLIATLIGGTDVITGESPPAIQLRSAILHPDQHTVNLNPFTTVIVAAAEHSDQGLSVESIRSAQSLFEEQPYGLRSKLAANPLQTPVNAQNVAELIAASETLAEVLRRTSNALAMPIDAVIATLAADLADGSINGRGAAGTDPEVAVVANTTTAQALVESLSGTLTVNGILFDEFVLDAAAATMFADKTSTVQTAAIAPTAAVLKQASVATEVALAVGEDTRLTALNAALKSMPSDADGAKTTLSIAGVTAGESQSVPSNTLDSDLGTRWSAKGDGEWIQYDLGRATTVNSISIAWFAGDERTATFDIDVSTDASSWTTVFSGPSSGGNLNLEPYDVTDMTARYVRIVGHGNSRNDWNSITEVRIHSTSVRPTDFVVALSAQGTTAEEVSNAAVEATRSAVTLSSAEIAKANAAVDQGSSVDETDDSQPELVADNTEDTEPRPIEDTKPTRKHHPIAEVKQGRSTPIDVLGFYKGLKNKPIKLKITTKTEKSVVARVDNGQVIYQSRDDVLGSDNVGFKITDADGDSVLGTLAITITCPKTACDRIFSASWRRVPGATRYCLYHRNEQGKNQNRRFEGEPRNHPLIKGKSDKELKGKGIRKCVGDAKQALWTLPVYGTSIFAITAVVDGVESVFSKEKVVVSY